MRAIHCYADFTYLQKAKILLINHSIKCGEQLLQSTMAVGCIGIADVIKRDKNAALLTRIPLILLVWGHSSMEIANMEKRFV